jgi:hypothetical protein
VEPRLPLDERGAGVLLYAAHSAELALLSVVDPEAATLQTLSEGAVSYRRLPTARPLKRFVVSKNPDLGVSHLCGTPRVLEAYRSELGGNYRGNPLID